MNWQDFIAMTIVAVAATYLGRQAWLIIARKKSGGCGGGGCRSCPSDTTQEQLVTIGEINGAERHRATK